MRLEDYGAPCLLTRCGRMGLERSARVPEPRRRSGAMSRKCVVPGMNTVLAALLARSHAKGKIHD
jgi:hypothetical protein